jgi:hypothetical protein
MLVYEREVKFTSQKMNTKEGNFIPVTFLAIFNIFWFISPYRFCIIMGLGCSASIATVYELRNGGIWLWFPAGTRDFTLFTGSTARLRPTQPPK